MDINVHINTYTCMFAREHLIKVHIIHRKLVINGILVYIHDAHIRLGIGFAGTHPRGFIL